MDQGNGRARQRLAAGFTGRTLGMTHRDPFLPVVSVRFAAAHCEPPSKHSIASKLNCGELSLTKLRKAPNYSPEEIRAH